MIKKVLVLSAFCFVAGIAAVSAQTGLLGKAASTLETTAASGFNVKSLTSTIVKQELTPKLSLTSAQVPKVSSAVSTFLTAKEKILPLAKTSKAAYAAKQSSLLSSLKSNLATTLAKQQMNKFLGLQSTTTSSSPLSYLFH